MEKPKGPDNQSAAYRAMLPAWAKLDTVLEGTDAMRAAAGTYLPQHERESDTRYQERLQRNTLLNMLQMTLDSWTGKPFGKSIVVSDDTPDSIKAIHDNVDLQGNNIDVFSRHWFNSGLAKGFSHVMVDFPRPADVGNRKRTLRDDREELLRPFLVHIPPENLFFAYKVNEQGVERLAHVRIMETVTEMKGFEEITVRQIRQIEPGMVTIYREQQVRNTRELQWVAVDEYPFDLNYIPITTFYAEKQGFMLSKPPLLDLADLNVSHWQSNSDQLAILTVARFPILAASGAMSDTDVNIGPNKWLCTPDPSGRFYYVEHSGAAINSGREHLLDLEEKMAGYGATFLQKRPGGASATARALDSVESTSPLQDMAVRFKDSLKSAMQMAADWLGEDTGGEYQITTDFGLSDEGGAKLQALQLARASNDISREVYLTELKRFGVLSESFVIATNQTQLTSEIKNPTVVRADAAGTPPATPKEQVATPAPA